MRAGIVITCYDQARYLAESLQSVLDQTVDDWEAVVVDDASPDGGAARGIVDSMKDPRVRLIAWDTNRGVSAARNAGIRETGAPVFACLDADDKFHPKYLEQLIPILELEEEVDCAFPDLLRFGLRCDLLPMRVPVGNELFRNVCPPGAGTLMRRTLWERIGGYDEADALRIGLEDREFFIRAFASGCRAVHLAEPLYFYRISGESRSTRAYRDNHVARRYIYRKHKAIFDAAGEGRRFVATGFDRAARAANGRGARLRGFWLSFRALWICPSANRLRTVGRFFLPEQARSYWTARRRGRQLAGDGPLGTPTAAKTMDADRSSSVTKSLPGEERRNRLLRSADWRFTLPPPPDGRFEHLVLIGGPAWLPDLVVELGVARKVSREIPSKGSADGLALLDDAKVDLAEAFACLARGGAVYWEVERQWSSWLRSTPRAVRLRLFDAGLVPLALYWPRNGFRYPDMYVPIDARGVLSWYVDSLMKPKSSARRAAQLFLRLLARAGAAWQFALLPRYAVTATAGETDRGGFPLGAEIPVEGRELLPFVLLRGWDPTRRVIAFLFSPEARRPCAVVKFWRLPNRNEKVEEEQATLRRIRSRLDRVMARTVPMPLGTLRRGEIVAGIESYAPGRPLSDSASTGARSRRRKLDDLRLVFDWIREFHRQAQVSREPWDRASLEHWVEEPLSKYRSAFEAGPDEERLFAAVCQRARTLLGSPLPVVWAHGDLRGANIHRHGRDIAVVDWVGATARLPLFDLLYFVMLWVEGWEKERGLSARLGRVRKIFVSGEEVDSATRCVREGLRGYLNGLGIDSRFLPLLLTMSWVARSLECHDRERAVERGDPGANPHPGESYVEYVRLLAGATEALFSRPRPWWAQ